MEGIKCRQNLQKEELFIIKEKKAAVVRDAETRKRNPVNSVTVMTAGLFSGVIIRKFPTV